jgi:L-ascorbate oxidase
VEGKAKPPFDYVAEKVLTFGNYFNKTDDVTESQLTASPIKWSGETKAITLQGQSGTAPFNKSTESSCQPYIIAVEPNKQYRLRVIGASALTIIKMAIEGHCNLTVIEADGRYTRPVTIDHIQVAPGQRFSFLLQTKSEKELKRLGKSQFWIRYESRDRPTLSAGYALLRYEVAKKLALPTQLPKTSPIVLPNNTHDYLEHCLQPFASEDRQGFPKRSEVTRTVFLQMAIKVPPGSFVDGEFEATADWA